MSPSLKIETESKFRRKLVSDEHFRNGNFPFPFRRYFQIAKELETDLAISKSIFSCSVLFMLHMFEIVHQLYIFSYIINLLTFLFVFQIYLLIFFLVRL